MDPCDECGYRYPDLARQVLGEALVEAADRVIGALADAGTLRQRPEPEVWSALEYGCHVRDILDVQRNRIGRALVEETPAFEPMGREERVTELAYNERDPQAVAADLAVNAEALAATVTDLDDEGWERTGIYNWPEPAERSVEWIVRHTVHELVHHRRDIEAVGAGRVP